MALISWCRIQRDPGGSSGTLLLVAVKAMNSPKSREKTSYKIYVKYIGDFSTWSPPGAPKSVANSVSLKAGKVKDEGSPEHPAALWYAGETGGEGQG